MRQFFQRLATLFVAMAMLVMPVAVMAEEGGGSPPPPPPPPPPSSSPAQPMPQIQPAPQMMPPPPGSQPGMMPGQGGPMMGGNMMPPPGGMPGMMPGMDKGMMGNGIMNGGMMPPPPGSQPGMMPGQAGPMMGNRMMNGDMMNGTPSGMMDRKMGPSSEEMQIKTEQHQQDQQKKMQTGSLKRMQQGMKQFSKMLAMFKSKMDKLASQGAPVPADCKEAVSQAQTTVDAIMNADAASAAEDIDMSGLQEAGETLQECGPKLEQAAQLPKIIKQVNGQISQLDKRVKAIQAKADRAKLDVSGVMGKITEAVATLKAAVAGLATDDDPFSTLQDMPQNFQDIQQQLNGLEAVFQLQKAVKSVGGQLARYEQKVKRLEKNGDGADERETLEQLKGLVAELKGMQLTNETADELPDKLQQLFELKQNLDDALQSSAAPKLFDAGGSGGGQFNFSLPDFNKLMLDQRQLQRYVAKLDDRIEASVQRVAGLKIFNSGQ